MAQWYYRKITVVIGLLTLGPLAFPLLWKSPEYNLFWKILLTVAFTGLTVYLTAMTWRAFNSVWDELKKLGLI
jgi:hypothetical protein